MTELTVRSGSTLRIDENDYLYGQGQLILKAVSVGDARRWPDDVWVPITGVQLRYDGTEMGRREVQVRARALNRVSAG